jgi:ABC-type polysaccharide/polyol phosphate export permease
MTPLIEGYRDCIIHGRWPLTARFAFAAGLSMALAGLGWLCFRRSAHRFAECI